MSGVEEITRLLDEAESYKEEFESRFSPVTELNPEKPITFISVGGGELGDLAITAAKRRLGGSAGGIKAVAFDRYNGFPAQDVADHSEVFDMMNGDLLERNIRKYIPDTSQRHAIYLEIEQADTRRACKLGIESGYNIMSTPYGPLICMDRYLTKLMLDRLEVPRVEWGYAQSQKEIDDLAKDFGLPVIVKPRMTSSGHGTTIAETQEQLKDAYEYSKKHARGTGNEVTVERFLPELKTKGTEITQLVIRHFDANGKLVTSLAPLIEHRRPKAVYHESNLPATISDTAREKVQEGAKKIAEFIGGLGIYSVEGFCIEDIAYINEVANRQHDTGLITRDMLNMDEGAMMLYSTTGLELTPFDFKLSRSGYGVAHVILAPDFGHDKEVIVGGFDINATNGFVAKKGYDGEVWYFGKPTAYASRRMGLAVGFDEDIGRARKVAEDIAHFAERCIKYSI